MTTKYSKWLATVALAACLLQTQAATSVVVTDTGVGEASGFAEVRIFRHGDLNPAFTVSYVTTTDGTAAPGVNFIPQSGALNFAAGEREKHIRIPILNDGVVNFGGGSFGIELRDATAGVQIAEAQGHASVWIRDSQYRMPFDPRFVSDIRSKVAAQRADGQLLIAEADQFGSWEGDVRLVLLNPDGSRAAVWPATFERRNDRPPLDGRASIHSLFCLTDGKVLAIGDFTHVSGLARPGIVRVNADGSVDSSFAPDLPEDNVAEAIPLPDGRVIVVTANPPWDTGPPRFVIRLNNDGKSDPSFKPVQISEDGSLAKIMPDLQGRILVGGTFGRVGDTKRSGLARLNSDGSLDTGFVPLLRFDPHYGPSWVASIAVQPNGKILIAGDFTSVNGLPRRYVARLNEDGSTDETFEYRPATRGVRLLKVDADGTVLAAGADGVQRLANDGTRIAAASTGGIILTLLSSKDGMALVVWWDGEGHDLGLRRVFLDHAPRTGVALSPWPGSLSFFPFEIEVTEPPDSSGQQVVTVYRLGDVTGPASVRLTTRDGSARAGEDYTAIDRTLTFAPFEQEKDVVVSILADDVFDPDETFDLLLTDVTGIETVISPGKVKINDGRASIFADKIKRRPDGSVEVAFYTSPARGNYVLEASSDLRTWLRVPGNAIQDPSLGPNRYRMVDRQAGASTARFYRLKGQ